MVIDYLVRWRSGVSNLFVHDTMNWAISVKTIDIPESSTSILHAFSISVKQIPKNPPVIFESFTIKVSYSHSVATNGKTL